MPKVFLAKNYLFYFICFGKKVHKAYKKDWKIPGKNFENLEKSWYCWSAAVGTLLRPLNQKPGHSTTVSWGIRPHALVILWRAKPVLSRSKRLKKETLTLTHVRLPFLLKIGRRRHQQKFVFLQWSAWTHLQSPRGWKFDLFVQEENRETERFQDGHQDFDERIHGGGGDRRRGSQPALVLGQRALAPLPWRPLLGSRPCVRRWTGSAAANHRRVGTFKWAVSRPL